MSGHFRGNLTAAAAKVFPDEPQFSHYMKPCRFEGEINHLEVIGEIPEELDGTFYRVMPDPQFPPFVENDSWFNGDGNVSALRIHQGNVHLKQKWVRTEKFVREREAQRALAGKYRNKYTDAVEFRIRTTANTNVFYFNKMLFAIKEDAPPYAMDPETLDTIGLWDFNGELPSLTFTAHPVQDPVTKELVCFGYEAKGEGTNDICYYTINPDGKLAQTVWFKAPEVGMIHDCGVTDNWVLFPMIPTFCDIERMKQGGDHWQWDSNMPFYLGVLPRRGASGSDVKWFRAPNAFPGHTANAYERPDGKIVFRLPLFPDNVFVWWPDVNGKAPNPAENHSQYVQFVFDPKSESLDLPEPELILDRDVEFPRVDDRFSTKENQHTFCLNMDPSLGTDFPRIASVLGGGYPLYNSICHVDHKANSFEVYFPGSTHMLQEPAFVPRSDDAPEGDGYVMALVNNYSTMTSELHIIDTRDFTNPQAVVKLNIRLRPGLHGNWVDAKDISK